MKTRDSDIRVALHEALRHQFRNDLDTIVLDELYVCAGEVVVDVAVVNGSLHGFEIKSDVDTLARLPRQVENYGKVFDYVSLVCSHKFTQKLSDYIPSWWGVVVAAADDSGQVILDVLREAKKNGSVDALSLAEMLWKDELVSLLSARGCEKKRLRDPKYLLVEHVAEVVPVNELRDYVRACLKAREDWKPGALHRLCDDLVLQ